jgi:hypothetical protein
MTNKPSPYYTGQACDPAAEPTPTELRAWLRGREAWVDDRLSATWEGLVKALDAKLEPVTKQLLDLQLQADATNRQIDQHIVADQPHSAQSYYTYTSGVERRLEGHIRSVDPHPHACEVIDETVRDIRRDFTHHLYMHEGLEGGEEPDRVVGSTGDGQSDLGMIRYSQQLREAYRTFMRYAADPTVPKQKFDLAVHEFRENVFELTSWMRTAVSSREGQGAQAT